jgi:hypothetical protein
VETFRDVFDHRAWRAAGVWSRVMTTTFTMLMMLMAAPWILAGTLVIALYIEGI